jgi:hypothetical protein
MQLNDLESAWKQFKVLNGMQHVESSEILSIIEMAERVNRTRLRLINLTMFMMVTILCQAG